MTFRLPEAVTMMVFVIAMANEAETVVRHLDGVRQELTSGRAVAVGMFRGSEVAVITAGVGKVNAAAGAQLAIDRYGAGKVYNIGVAGGLRATMKPFETYTIARSVQYDFDLAKLNGTTVGTLNEYDSPYLPLDPVAGFPCETSVTGDRFSDDPCEIGRLVDVLDGGVRDMELGAIAHVCRRAGVKAASLKTLTNVHAPGAAAMTAQYAENLPRALEALSESVLGLLRTEAV